MLLFFFMLGPEHRLAPPGPACPLLPPPGPSWLLVAPPGLSWPLLGPFDVPPCPPGDEPRPAPRNEHGHVRMVSIHPAGLEFVDLVLESPATPQAGDAGLADVPVPPVANGHAVLGTLPVQAAQGLLGGDMRNLGS